MTETYPKRILIVAGGTGGHVFPALAVALNLKEKGHSILFITDRRGQQYVKPYWETLSPVMLPLDRKNPGLLGFLKLTFQFLRCFMLSLIKIIQFKPHSVVGFSGFPTFSTLGAAVILGYPVGVHEQNAVLGRVNRFFAPFVRKILLSFPVTIHIPNRYHKKVKVVGFPIRPEVASLASQPYDKPKDTVCLLVVGGSQGARSFADVIPHAIGLLPDNLQRKLHIVQQGRKEDLEQAKALYKTTQVGSFKLSPFIEDMAGAFAQAHLIITRGGAATLSEIKAAGTPAIFIPFPYATDDHQTFNALTIVKKGGGWLLPHQRFTPSQVADLLMSLLEDQKKLLYASERLREGFEKNAIKHLAQQILTL